MKTILKFILTALAVLLAAELVVGITVAGFGYALLVALVLGIVNVTIRPILKVLTFPITFLTLGLFALVINALMFWMVAAILEGFAVEGFVAAFLGALVVSVVTGLGDWILDED